MAQDLREWRLASGLPADSEFIIPAHGGGQWTEVGYEQWINHVWRPALQKAQLEYQRPYDLRHSFASLLLHEGRNPIYVARQLGNSAVLIMKTYGHVIEELEDAPQLPAEDAILRARDVRTNVRTAEVIS